MHLIIAFSHPPNDNLLQTMYNYFHIHLKDIRNYKIHIDFGNKRKRFFFEM